MTQPISVILADDHPMVLQGIKACLEESDAIDVVGVVPDGETLVRTYGRTPCDVVVVDINLPGMNGIEAVQTLKASHGSLRALMFTMHHDVEYARRAIAAGATGFVLKDALPSELIHAIQTVHHGGTFFPPDIAKSLATGQAPVSTIQPSEREIEVLRAVAAGKSSKVIAWEMGLSVRTVETHRRNLRQKLGGKSTAECISIAYNAGLISPAP